MPLIMLRLVLRSRKIQGYGRRWNERFGYAVIAKKEMIWLHAVSVGETIAAAPLVKSLQTTYPACELMITTMTPTGLTE